MEVFEALAEPKRRKMLRLLSEAELSASGVGSHFRITQPAVSQHLRVLRKAGLVSERRAGTRRLYSLRADGLADLQSFLSDVLPARLERLKQAAEEEEKGRATVDAHNKRS